MCMFNQLFACFQAPPLLLILPPSLLINQGGRPLDITGIDKLYAILCSTYRVQYMGVLIMAGRGVVYGHAVGVGAQQLLPQTLT